jgi:peptidoglycan/xylan/chitin deacetylase (PgdA/CDA1 family)
LQVLSDHNVKATFFTLGWVAERYPNIVTKIIENGHELVSHGYGHQRVTDLDREAFKADLIKAKDILEGISGQAIAGYRAPSYSIGKSNIWALVRQAKLGASCRVKVPVGQGFSHPPVSSVAFVAEHWDRISHSSQGC